MSTWGSGPDARREEADARLLTSSGTGHTRVRRRWLRLKQFQRLLGLTQFRSVHTRIRCLFLLAVLAFGCVVVRVGALQVLSFTRFSNLAKRQHEHTLTIPALRGTIYDSQGRPLAMTVMSESVVANPRQMSAADKVEVATALAGMLDVNLVFIQERLSRDKAFVWIQRQLTRERALDVRAQNLPWVHLVKEPKRVYPAGSLASHVLGYVGIDHTGLEGLEATFDSQLGGAHGERRVARDGKGRQLYHEFLSYRPPVDGHQIILTIDAAIQAIAEEALDAAYQKCKAIGGSVIVLDPKTGSILALANRPHFDPSALRSATADTRRNRAVTDVFEPGSVFKAMMASALLDAGLVTPEEEFFCEHGEFRTVGRHILHDHRPHGTLPFTDVVAFSSNICMAKAAQRLEPQQLHAYVERFGFGQRADIDVPGEVKGIVHAPEDWSKLSPFIIPIGQEVGVTVIQMASAMGAIANNGILLKPHVVKAIHARDGRLIKAFRPTVREQVITPSAAAITRALLVGVVERGSGRMARVKGFDAGGNRDSTEVGRRWNVLAQEIYCHICRFCSSGGSRISHHRYIG
jgi:cell division protein FtsI (penicillin-binding protein 3)